MGISEIIDAILAKDILQARRALASCAQSFLQHSDVSLEVRQVLCVELTTALIDDVEPMPAPMCECLDVEVGSTYAQGAEALRQHLCHRL